MRTRKINDELGDVSFRTNIGYLLFAILVILPNVFAWQHGSESVSRASETQNHWGVQNRGIHRLEGRINVRERMNQGWFPDASRMMWLFGKTSLAVIGATVSLMILMPFRGCKRFALLFGPPTGLFVSMAVGFWLMGRDEIQRFEPVVVALVAALPTVTLWFFCCKWAYEKGSVDTIIDAELTD